VQLATSDVADCGAALRQLRDLNRQLSGVGVSPTICQQHLGRLQTFNQDFLRIKVCCWRFVHSRSANVECRTETNSGGVGYVAIDARRQVRRAGCMCICVCVSCC
jgi:hypothetical protein